MAKKFNMNILTESVSHSTVTISDGTKVKIRAMLVKEYKLLMLANATNDKKEENFLRILKNCILSDIDLDLLPIFDLEILYLHVWHLSKGTWIIPITYSCRNKIKQEDGSEKTCNTKIEMQINTAGATISARPKKCDIKINESLTIEMRYPTVGEIEYFDTASGTDVFELVMRCIRAVYLNGEEYVVNTDISPDELTEVIDYLDEDKFLELAEFIKEMPRISLDFPIKCPECGYHENQRLVGLNDFFI